MSLKAVDPVAQARHDGDQIVQDAREQAIRLAATGALLGPVEMAAIFNITVNAFYKNAKRGLYDVFKVQPPLSPRCFSGFLITQYLHGERVGERTFGRKAMRHGR